MPGTPIAFQSNKTSPNAIQPLVFLKAKLKSTSGPLRSLINCRNIKCRYSDFDDSCQCFGKTALFEETTDPEGSHMSHHKELVMHCLGLRIQKREIEPTFPAAQNCPRESQKGGGLF